MIDWDAYSQKVMYRGDTLRDRRINNGRKQIERIAPDHPSYQQCTVDDTTEVNLLVMGSDDLNKKKFKVMPTDAAFMHYGSLVKWNNAFWLVTELDFDDTVTKGGYMKFCNIELHFQIGEDTTVHSCFGVFDKGVYSTNVSKTNVAQIGHLQRMIYLPLNDKTKYLHRDKRIATNKIPFPDGHDELQCFVIVSYDTIADSSNDGQLLTLGIEEDQFSPDFDNVELLVCNYTAPAPPPDPEPDPDIPEPEPEEDTQEPEPEPDDEGGGWV